MDNTMRRKLLHGGAALIVGVAVLAGAVSAPVQACSNNQQSCSGGYGVSEVFFGNGGSLDDTCSSHYCAQQSAGETGVGAACGTAYCAQAGYNTGRAPSLTLVVNDSQCAYYNNGVNLGYLSPNSTTTGNVNFSVESYLAGGYAVKTVGAPPVSNGSNPHTLAPLTGGGASVAGTEQFGMNLVANTSPGFGANPVQKPDTSFGFGQAASGYDTPNVFRYNDGDTIARSAKSSGTTCYSLSYIFNISGATPDGVYTFNQAIVVTSTF